MGTRGFVEKGPGKTTPTKTLSHAGKNALAHRGWSNDARSIDQADYYKTKKRTASKNSVKRLLEIGKLKKIVFPNVTIAICFSKRKHNTANANHA